MVISSMNSERPTLDPRIRRTRQMLFEALKALLGEKTFEEISVQDIAERSTVNRATFYDHFPDKFALLEALIGEGFQAIFAARMVDADGTDEESLRRLILAVCDFLNKTSDAVNDKKRSFGPMVESIMESKIRSIVREFLLESLRRKNRSEESEPIPAAKPDWAICDAAREWHHTKKRLVRAVCDFFAKATSGCHAPEQAVGPVVESMVESKIKDVVQASLFEGTPAASSADAEMRATVASWAICGAALEWNRTRSMPAENLVESVLPLIWPTLSLPSAGAKTSPQREDVGCERRAKIARKVAAVGVALFLGWRIWSELGGLS